MNRQNLLFIALAFISAGAYLALAASRGAVGFPLDDAWIHQVYARNLGTRGEFAFFAGQPSAGSTAPLWTILLAVGYFARIEYHAWTYIVGALLTGASAFLAGRLAERVFAKPLITVYCSLFTVLEWHMAWSAVSGMEIPLFVLLSLLLVERFYARERNWVIGFIGGLLTLTRPEGVVLAGLVGLAILFWILDFGFRIWQRDAQNKVYELRITIYESARTAFSFALGYALLIIPYLLFNLVVSGSVLPNTFFAKNAEYQILLERTSFIARYLQLLFVPFVGAQLLLVPGIIYALYSLVKRALGRGADFRVRQTAGWKARATDFSDHLLVPLLPFVWLLLLPALYALRLPVAYQHGRYEMPIIPFIVVYGVAGTALLLERVQHFVIRATWALSTAATLIAFWFLGANAYATDVAIIDCEMVQTARWATQNMPRGARVAAHDIGALGYYYDEPFIDLAGLVSPEVIPFIRDESRLRDYLLARNTQYAVFFPDWYPALDSDPRFTRVFQTDCAVTRREGGTNMAVYGIVLTTR